jgi:hypothetical protein
MATTKSFAVAPQKVTPNQTNFIYPMNCSVSGLKPNSTYDFYVDGKKYNKAVVQGSNKVYDGNGEPTGLKSDAAGKCSFTYYPVIVNGINFGGGNQVALAKKIELK